MARDGRGCRPRFARLAASPLPRACIALTKSEENERLLAVYTLGVGDSLLLPLFSFLGIDVNGSKGLSPTPSVGNLSLRPCRYLSTVTRSSNQGSVDGLKRERLQR